MPQITEGSVAFITKRYHDLAPRPDFAARNGLQAHGQLAKEVKNISKDISLTRKVNKVKKPDRKVDTGSQVIKKLEALPEWEDEVDAGDTLTMTADAPLALLYASLPLPSTAQEPSPKRVLSIVGKMAIHWNRHHAEDFFLLLRCVGERMLREDLIQEHIKEIRRKKEAMAKEAAAAAELATPAAAAPEASRGAAKGTAPSSPKDLAPTSPKSPLINIQGWDRQVKTVALSAAGQYLDGINDESLNEASPSLSKKSKKRQRISTEQMDIQILGSLKASTKLSPQEQQSSKAGAKLWCATMRAPRSTISTNFFKKYPQKHTVVVGVQPTKKIREQTEEATESQKFDLVAVVSHDLHSLGNVCRRVQNASIRQIDMIDRRLAVLDRQVALMLQKRGGSFKMTTVRTDFEDEFNTALVPSLFGCRWVKDLMLMLPFTVQVKPLDDDVLIMTATEESAWTAMRQRVHVAGQIQRTQHLTAAPDQRMEDLETMCKDMVTPLLLEISEDYAKLLRFDIEFCQVLFVLDQFEKLTNFFQTVRDAWTGELLSRPPHAWLDGIARGILKTMSAVQDVTTLKPLPFGRSKTTEIPDEKNSLTPDAKMQPPDPVAMPTEPEPRPECGPRTDFWEDIDRIQDSQSVGPIGGFHGRCGFSAPLWTLSDLLSDARISLSKCMVSASADDEYKADTVSSLEEKKICPESGTEVSYFSNPFLVKPSNESDDATPEPLSPLQGSKLTADNVSTITETPAKKKEAQVLSCEVSPSGVDEPIPISIHKGPQGLQLESEFDLESEDIANDENKENVCVQEVNSKSAGAAKEPHQCNAPNKKGMKRNGIETLEEIYDGLKLTKDAKLKLAAADILDVSNLASFQERDVEEIGLKVASRVKVRAWINHANDYTNQGEN